MAFHSYSFFIFFPLVMLVYFVLPKKHRWLWLLGASYYFYMCWNPQYVLLIAFSTIVTYACARFMEKCEATGRRCLILAGGICANLAVLFFFKYYNFTVDLVLRAFSAFGGAITVPQLDILLPVGISFYTFQAIGYTIDVYRGKVPAERNLLRYVLFVSFFPQLVAGPIERSENLLRQVNNPKDFDWDRAVQGLSIMVLGFFEKLVIADRASLYVDVIFQRWYEAAGWQIWLGIFAFAFQIYGDFSGYSHIAIGAAKILGYELMDNFRQPFFAVSIRDFWRRWHISLSTWFRDYLYIPLGGNRVKKGRWRFNMLITFAVSGLWHGASMNFLVWGLLNGALQIVEEGVPRRRIPRILGVLSTFMCISLIFTFFRATALMTAVQILWRAFVKFARPGMNTGFGVDQAGVLIVAIIVLLLIDFYHERGKTLMEHMMRCPWFIRQVFLWLAVMCIVVFGIWGSGYTAQAFLYFQF